MTEQPPQLEPADSETLARLRLRTQIINAQARRFRRPQVGYFDDHPPRDAYREPPDES